MDVHPKNYIVDVNVSLKIFVQSKTTKEFSITVYTCATDMLEEQELLHQNQEQLHKAAMEEERRKAARIALHSFNQAQVQNTQTDVCMPMKEPLT